MAINPWKSFRSRYFEPTTGGGLRQVDPPRRAAVRRWEKANHLALPDRFVDFICLLGPGDFTGTFTIAAPDCANAGPRCDLTTLNSDFHRYNPESQLREYHRDPESVLRIFAFGVTFRGDFVGWDTRHVTSSRPREYPVLLLSRAAEETDVIAETFEEFVNDWCLGNKYLRLSPEEQEDPEWAKRVYKAANYL